MARRQYDFSAERIATNEELSDEIAKHSALSQTDLDELVPRPIDRRRLQKLIEIVNSSGSKNRKLAQLRTNLSEVGGVMLKVLSKLV